MPKLNNQSATTKANRRSRVRVQRGVRRCVVCNDENLGLGWPHPNICATCDSVSIEDTINGLKHMADDHKCCKPFIEQAIRQLEAVMIGHCTICYTCAKLCPPNAALSGAKEKP